METSYLREFIVLAEVGNYHEAADRLFISQSSLSKHIKIVETELGTPLFERTARGILLNEYGRHLLPYARQTLQLENRYKKELYNKVNTADRGITIGSEYPVDDLLRQFRLSCPKYFVRKLDGNIPGEVEKYLRKGSCELGFLYHRPDLEEEFITLPYLTDSFCAVLPASHPLAGSDSLYLKQLQEEEFVLLPEFSIHSELSRRMCEESGFFPKVIFNGSTAPDILNLVKTSMGISILMLTAAKSLNPDGIALIPLRESPELHVLLCYRRNIKLTTAAREFLSFL